LQALGFPVAGWTRSAKQVPGFVTYAGAAGLNEMLARSDILVCLLPMTPETENILDGRLFARLPRGAGLVNAGRGRHLVENDLLAALDGGQLSAAVLDVFRDEPLPPGHPFWRHPRIVITPHVAADTHPPTALPIIADAIRDLEAGRPVANLVDPRRGY
jgi:glyoxylate/hydroxypyruvate reductase A